MARKINESIKNGISVLRYQGIKNGIKVDIGVVIKGRRITRTRQEAELILMERVRQIMEN